jgi:hypothetical protein
MRHGSAGVMSKQAAIFVIDARSFPRIKNVTEQFKFENSTCFLQLLRYDA